MVIFRILFNLFRLGTRLFFSVFWLPFYLLTRNLFVVILLIGAVVIYFAFNDDSGSTAKQNANPVRMERNAQGQMVQAPSVVARVENGNSAFANDLYAQMTDEEKAYYSQFFFWAMANVADNQTHSWSNVDIGGAITPGNSFKNKSGVPCRMFSETLKVHAVQQQISGMACQQSDGKSWCKLQANATPACGLGHTPGLLEGITSSLGL